MINQEMKALIQNREPGAHIVWALNQLFKKDKLLLQIDANERSITHRLAMYLQQRFPDHHVDCEYNRKGNVPKQVEGLELRPDANDTNAKTVYPDIIVHRRDTTQNLLVIELKKSSNQMHRGVDLAKLKAYREDLGYTFALFIELSVGPCPCVTLAKWVGRNPA